MISSKMINVIWIKWNPQDRSLLFHLGLQALGNLTYVTFLLANQEDLKLQKHRVLEKQKKFLFARPQHLGNLAI